MKINLLVTSAFGLGFLTMMSAPALAHHGNAAYADNFTEFKNATVTQFAWTNPHAMIDFDVKDATGKPMHIVVEAGPASNIRLIGWTKTSIAPGDVVTLRVYMAKSGNPAGRLNKIVLKDGTELHDTQLGGDADGKTSFNPPSQ
jgi:hypothetical protein